MKQKERLANLLDEFWLEHYDCCNTDAMTEHLLSNGVIVPPCKVGDTVFDIGGFPKIMKAEIETITTDGTEMSSVVVNPNKPYHRWFVNWKYIGKTVFLTREAAKQALKERGE